MHTLHFIHPIELGICLSPLASQEQEGFAFRRTVGSNCGTVFAAGRVVDLSGVAPWQHRDLLLDGTAGTHFLTGWPLGSVEEHGEHGLDVSNYSSVMN